MKQYYHYLNHRSGSDIECLLPLARHLGFSLVNVFKKKFLTYFPLLVKWGGKVKLLAVSHAAQNKVGVLLVRVDSGIYRP